MASSDPNCKCSMDWWTDNTYTCEWSKLLAHAQHLEALVISKDEREWAAEKFRRAAIQHQAEKSRVILPLTPSQIASVLVRQ